MYDVIIVGAGPAGSAAAKILAENGFKVAIFEKMKLPRFKACGGGVAIQCLDSLKKLEVDVEEVALQEYKGFMLSYRDIIATCKLDMIMGWGVYRKDFDYLLTKKAENSGAKVFDKQKVIGFKENGDNIKLVTESGVEQTRILFGADGINSTIRKKLGIDYDRSKLGFCLESEIKTTKSKIEEYGDMINLDLSCLKEGYAWVFPKKRAGTVNVGIGTYLETAQSPDMPMKDVLLKFIRDKGLSDKLTNLSGALIPFGGTVNCFGKQNTILLGDAAGMVSPMSGEGIPYALDSGVIAAECAISFFENQTNLVDKYSKSVFPIAREINEYAIALQKRLYGSKSHRKLIVKMCANYPDFFDTVGKIFLHIIPYEQGIEKLSPIKLLPKFLGTWYSDSIWSPISPYVPKSNSRWVRM